MRSRRNAGTHSLRILASLAFTLLVLTGCGGDDASDTGSDAPDAGAVGDTGEGGGDTTTGTTEDETTDEGGTDADATDAAATAGAATVTIGDETFVADQQIVCVQIGGALGGSWSGADGAISISIDLPPQDWEDSPDDWEAPSIRVDDDRDEMAIRQLQANPQVAVDFDNIDDGDSLVLEYRVDGSSASGTARFVDAFGALSALASGEELAAPVEGTFSLTCE